MLDRKKLGVLGLSLALAMLAGCQTSPTTAQHRSIWKNQTASLAVSDALGQMVFRGDLVEPVSGQDIEMAVVETDW